MFLVGLWESSERRYLLSAIVAGFDFMDRVLSNTVKYLFLIKLVAIFSAERLGYKWVASMACGVLL